ncbi:SH3 domain-containing protein [Robiginitalea sp. SC105]|uniref:SH3 domain-containing protein n=1 Tax=Robiginitalea sp. SC105 TaxID=2762332 RepID=UPI00163A47CC|nr:tetratricopeptide repeat protein [Robiginitalea sp. SC105]MBC2838051.1 tetratricopeptide repeat protein [Robiginitalea sp. SC105]
MKPSRPLLFLVLFLLAAPAALPQADSLFYRATDAYNEGAYQQAVDNYQQILESDQHSAALYYNLGNAYYKLGQIAPSIYYYEKALLLKPGDPEIRNNLAFARNMTLDAIQPLPETQISRWYNGLLYRFSIDQWAYMGIVCMFLFVMAYLAFYRLYQPNQKRIALISSLLFLGLCIVTTALAYLQRLEYRADQPAIIFAGEVTVRSEPNRGASEAFKLHEGTRVQVRDSLADWRKILLADGQSGWMPAEDLKLLKKF